MIKDICISDDNTKVIFYKKLFHESEIVLAKCFGFHVDIENEMIVADISQTSKDSMYNFIRLSYKNFNEALSESVRREDFYSRLEAIYVHLDNYVQDIVTSTLPFASKLYHHQREGIRFSFFNRCSFLAFTMRLGKSIVAASLSRVFKIKRTLIICPSVAKMGWFKDLTETWGFNQMYFSILDASKTKTFKTNFGERFVIVNYDTLEKHMDYILSSDIGHVIIDEVHRCKNKNSRRFALVSKITSAFPQAKLTLLSGTAIPNRFNDLFAYFKLTGHHLGLNYKKFCEEFTTSTAGRGGDRVTGAKNIADLKMKMSNFMLVRTMDECFDMPDDVVSRYTFQMDDYRPEYDKIIKEMSEQRSLSSLNGNIHTLNIITCKSKIKGIIEALEEIIEETGKVVVFGSYKEPLQELYEYFGDRSVKVDGSTSSSERFNLRTRFMEDPSIQVFLGNYLAAGEALDLSVSSDVFTINFPMTPRELQQALFRCKHPEKRKHLRIHHAICEDSIDIHLFDLIADKSRDINALLHDGKEVPEMENFTEILIKKLLNKNDIIFDNHSRKNSDPEKGKTFTPVDEGKVEAAQTIPGRSVFVPNPIFYPETTESVITEKASSGPQKFELPPAPKFI